MALSDIAKRLESVTSTATLGGRTLLGIDTNPVPGEWTHVTKVDPETDKLLPLAFPLFLSRTSSVSVGGSRDVTDSNTEETFELLGLADVPAFHEPSEATHVTDTTRDRAEFLAIPEVLNGDTEALIGTLGKGLDYVRDDLGPELLEEKLGVSVDSDGFFGRRLSNFAAGYLIQEAVFEAYIIMNLDSAAAREASVTADDLLTPEEAKQRALAAEYHLDSEIIYVEYSGTFGGDEASALLEAIDNAVTWPRIWYGGGLDSRENVEAVLDAGADAVVVGDIFHDIAREERSLFDRARETFDSRPDVEALRDWVREAVEDDDSSARRYLSTIPGVTKPDELAIENLTASIEFALVLESIADSLDEPDETAIRNAIRQESLLEQTLFGQEFSGRSDVVRELALIVIADSCTVPLDDSPTAKHLALEL